MSASYLEQSFDVWLRRYGGHRQNQVEVEKKGRPTRNKGRVT